MRTRKASAVRFQGGNKFVPVGKKKIAMSKYWLQHSDRREYDGLVFDPTGKAASNYLNLFDGFAISPSDMPQECSRFWELIFEVICRGEETLYEYIRKWMAHLVQFPGEKPGVALVFVGGRGVGKDTALSYLGRIFKTANYRSVSHPRHVVGNFNANQKECLLLHMQEGVFAGNKADSEQLKVLITSERVLIEPKHFEPFEIDSFMRLGITSNSLNAVPAAADERRFAVAECGAKQEAEFYERIYAEREAGGPSALLGELMSVDLSGFNVRRAPSSKGLQQQKLANLSGVAAWWLDVLASGRLPTMMDEKEALHADWDEQPVRVCKDECRNSFVHWNRCQKFTSNAPSSPTFTKLLKDVCPSVRDTRPAIAGSRVRCYEFPQRGQCIEEFERIYQVDLRELER